MSKVAIDMAVSSHSIDSVINELVWAGLFLIISFFSHLLAVWVNERSKAIMLIDLQRQVIDGQVKSLWESDSGKHTGDIMLRTITDCQEVVQVLGSIWLTIIITFLRVSSAIALLFWMDSKLTLILILVIPLALISKVYSKKVKRINKEIKDNEGRFSETLQENLGQRHFLRSIGWEEERLQKVKRSQDIILDKKMNLLNFSSLSKGVLGLILQLSFLVTFFWGTLKLHSGEISFGTMSAFLQLVARIHGPSVSLMAQIPILVKFKVSLERVLEIFSSSREEIVDNDELHIDSIKLSDVSFGYKEGALLQGLNLEFKQGEATVIIGESGKGKSTLLRLILGLYPYSGGQITLISRGEERLMENRYRINFSYVPQGQKMLPGTVLYNITGDSTNYKEERVAWALQMACAEFVYKLDQGLDTVVGEAGFGLSEGQAQRIGIARAILQNRPVWLFDEVSSALDEVTSKQLILNLLSLGKEKIIVMVTHDSTLQNFFKNVYKID